MSSLGQIQRKLKEDYPHLNIAAGRLPNYELLNKFGYNPQIDTGTTPEDVWANGGLYTGQPIHSAAAETVQVFSSLASDTNAAGAGARSIEIFGLNASWVAVSEIILLNGTTPVTSVNSYKRVFRGIVRTDGGTNGQGNLGTITCRHTTTTANVFFGILPGVNQTLVAAYTVPENCQLYVELLETYVSKSNNGATSCLYSLRARREGQPYRTVRYDTITNSSGQEVAVRVMFPARTDLLVRAQSVGSSSTSISSSIHGILLPA